MDDRKMAIEFEDIPLEEARKMGRGPRMESHPLQRSQEQNLLAFE